LLALVSNPVSRKAGGDFFKKKVDNCIKKVYNNRAMKTTTIKNQASSNYGGIKAISEHLLYRGIYFCDDGLSAVLGKTTFRNAEASLSPFAGSMEVKVKGRWFKSKKGKYEGCTNHPALVLELLGAKDKTKKEFRFYIK
jgi:hypothetical protein